YYYAFTTYGVNVNGGHEIHIINSWFGVRLWRSSEPQSRGMYHPGGREEESEAPPSFTSVAIKVMGFDTIIANIIVFSASLGIYIKGACNLVYNAHTWNGTSEHRQSTAG